MSPDSQDDAWEASPFVQISAWADGEGEGDLPGVLDTPEGRKAWDAYHLIGDTLRSSDLAMPVNTRFQDRMLAALEAEPAIVAAPVVPVAKGALRRRLGLGLSGLAVAAAVAAVAWMIQPYLGSTQDDGTTVADAGNAAIEESSLRDYLEAHRQIAGPSAVRQVSFDVGTSR
jgi:sigma-E factor negative regulatory protein RseA